MYDLSEKTENELWELTTGDEIDTRAEASHELAARCDRSGRSEQVPGLFGAAIDLFRTADNPLGVARASYAYGCYLIRNDEHADALPLLADAVAGYQAEAQYAWLADAYRWQASAWRGVGETDRALEDFAHAVTLYVDVDSYYLAAVAQLEIIELLGFLDRQDEALAATDAAMEFAEDAEDPSLPIRINDRAAAALIDLGEYDLALVRLREALSASEYVNDTAKINYQNFRLGSTLVLRGKFAEALEFLDHASEAFREADRLQDVVQTDLSRIECFYALGRNGEAQALLTQLESVTKPERFIRTRAAALILRAEVLASEGNYTRADELLAEAFILGGEVDDELLMTKVRIYRAEALVDIQKFSLALDQLTDLDVDEFGQNRVLRARLLAVRAAARRAIESDSTLAELDIHECLALGGAIGFARAHGRCYEQLSIIRQSEGRSADAKTLQSHATAVYLRAGLTALAEKSASLLLPDGYLSRSATTGPFTRPDTISSGVHTKMLMGIDLHAFLGDEYDAIMNVDDENTDAAA